MRRESGLHQFARQSLQGLLEASDFRLQVRAGAGGIIEFAGPAYPLQAKSGLVGGIGAEIGYATFQGVGGLLEGARIAAGDGRTYLKEQLRAVFYEQAGDLLEQPDITAQAIEQRISVQNLGIVTFHRLPLHGNWLCADS